MAVQDDAREREMLQLFNLVVPPERKRHDTDAFLQLKGDKHPFELKSTTSQSVSTVRDFGLDHIAKWRGKHWLFGFYEQSGATLLYACYASPATMEPWIARLEAYIWPDQALAECVPSLGIDEGTVLLILGEKPVYDLADARLIQKNQWSAARYQGEMDLADGYSLAKMVEILQDRCAYVIRRGSTLNNPHIPKGHFADLERITENHAARLRELVRQYEESIKG